MAQSSGAVEHRVRMPGAHHATATAGQGRGPTRPEKLLNCFVRSVALIERAGNALGTLAFTWATVVLLGGYPTAVGVDNNDFWFAITIFFLEAVRYRCIAASLLRSLCLHARHKLKATYQKELSSSLREVLERILLAEGAELEILIGLSSQISKTIPEEFARELEHGEMKEAFMKRLADVLDANMEPSGDCPGIRRMVLEQAINLMEFNSRYVNCFNNRRMINALSMVEETISEAENYNIILGDVGLVEAGEALPSLVARAKQLLAVH